MLLMLDPLPTLNWWESIGPESLLCLFPFSPGIWHGHVYMSCSRAVRGEILLGLLSGEWVLGVSSLFWQSLAEAGLLGPLTGLQFTRPGLLLYFIFNGFVDTLKANVAIQTFLPWNMLFYLCFLLVVLFCSVFSREKTYLGRCLVQNVLTHTGKPQ